MLSIYLTTLTYLTLLYLLPKIKPNLFINQVVTSRWLALFDCQLVATLALLYLTGQTTINPIPIYVGFCGYDILVRLVYVRLRQWDYFVHHIAIIYLGVYHPESVFLLEGLIWLYGDSVSWIHFLTKQYGYEIKFNTFIYIYYWFRFGWCLSLFDRAFKNGIQMTDIVIVSPLAFLTGYWAILATRKLIRQAQ